MVSAQFFDSYLANRGDEFLHEGKAHRCFITNAAQYKDTKKKNRSR